MSLRSGALPWLAGWLLVISGPALAADDPCSGFKWSVSEERAVFSQQTQSTKAGRDAPSAPAMKTSALYELALAPQESVKFVVPSGMAGQRGEKGPSQGTFAGVMHFRVPTPGTYRVSLDQGLWVDVVSHQALVEAKDFSAAHDCSAPRKIVQYNLPAREDLVLQLSGAAKDRVRVAITAAAPANPTH